MTLAEKNNILCRLGGILDLLSKGEAWSGYELGINEDEYNEFDQIIKSVHIYNGWFKEEQVRKSLGGIAKWLTESSLEDWLSSYSIKDGEQKRVAIIMAGNIPLVGFHDFVSVFLSGHIAVIKLSSEDSHLFPGILKILNLFDERISNLVELKESRIDNFNAVIATGSDNSSRYFESYFGKYPNIIRKNRSSIAVITGDETDDELLALGHDIFDFFGLGCRNVSQIWVPENYELDTFFKAIYSFKDVVNHNKYANNYDYNKAVKLLNEENLLDNGFLLLKEDRSLHSPLAVIHYQRYTSVDEVNAFIAENKDQIQVVVGKDYLPFGKAQTPDLNDYADGVDTMQFLTSL